MLASVYSEFQPSHPRLSWLVKAYLGFVSVALFGAGVVSCNGGDTLNTKRDIAMLNLMTVAGLR